MSEPVQPPDPARRQFFRQFARDAVTSVGSVMGAAQSLQESSADAARELLGVAPGADGVGRTGGDGPLTPAPSLEPRDAATAGWRAPFRWDGDVCRIVDQRRLPDILVDLELRSAADTVHAINDGALVGTSAQAQVGAVTLVLVAMRASASRAFARRATIRGAANALRLARPGSAPMAAALDRMLALLEAAGLETPGDEVAARLRAEAERIIGETIDDHGALVGHLVAALPGGSGKGAEPDRPGDPAPLRVLVAGSTGAMGGGQFGTALSAVQTIHHAGDPIHALVAEGRPGFEGARIAAWELGQAGVAHAVVTDAAGPGLVAAGEVDAVLVGADRVAANGDVIATTGAYPLALACAVTDTPFIVCATTTAIDLALTDGGAATTEQGRPTPVLRAAGTRVAPEGARVRNPLQEPVPAALVAAIVTEEGPLVAPFGPALAAAVEVAARRRASAPGFAALLARRAGPTEPAATSEPEAGRAPVDVAALRNPPRGAAS